MHDPMASYGMFGIYRWFLASAVVAAHLAPKEITHIGAYAVFAFFVLSGYLMTLVLSQRYLQISKGIRKYYINRFLRIYPTYAVVAIFSIILLSMFPDDAIQVNRLYQLPSSYEDIIVNITIVGLADVLGDFSQAILIFPAWSLGVEIIYWALLPFLLKTQTRLYLWGVFSVYITLLFIIEREPTHLRYFSVIGASIAFCFGVWIYYINQRIRIRPSWTFNIIIFSIVLFLTVFSTNIFADPFFEGFYILFLLNCMVICILSNVSRNHIPPWLLELDKLAGDLSYPIFLVHLCAGLIVYLLAPEWVEHRGYIYYVMALILSNMLAFIIYHSCDANIQKIRVRFRK